MLSSRMRLLVLVLVLLIEAGVLMLFKMLLLGNLLFNLPLFDELLLGIVAVVFDAVV